MANSSNSNLQVTGAWVPADGSANHIEIAACSDPNLRAVRNSYTPNDVFYVTPQMLTNFASAINSGQFRSLGLRN
jgi:hypothetical protein